MMSRFLIPLVVLLGSLLLMFSSSVSSSAKQQIEIHQATFPVRRMVQDDELHLYGAGLLKYAAFIKVYAAALYTPNDFLQPDVLDRDVAKRLEIAYFVSIDRQDLAKAANASLAKQHSAEALHRLRPQIERLHALYRDVQKGDRYALTYHPTQGMQLEFNGEVLDTFSDDDFARAYFGIWLGDPPIAPSLKKELIGQNKQP